MPALQPLDPGGSKRTYARGLISGNDAVPISGQGDPGAKQNCGDHARVQSFLCTRPADFCNVEFLVSQHSWQRSICLFSHRMGRLYTVGLHVW